MEWAREITWRIKRTMCINSVRAPAPIQNELFQVYKCEIFADLINIFQFFVILYRVFLFRPRMKPPGKKWNKTSLKKAERKKKTTNWTKWNYLECNIHHLAMARLWNVSSMIQKKREKVFFMQGTISFYAFFHSSFRSL